MTRDEAEATQAALIDAGLIPEPWIRPMSVTENTIPDLDLPSRESNDPAILAAWFDAFGAFENYRKVRLAHCRELTRAKYALKGEKVTETRLDDLSRLHPGYLACLEEGLRGRIEWEREKNKRGIGA